MKKLIFINSLLMLASACLLIQCSKKEPLPTKQAVSKTTQNIQPQPQAACNCGSLSPNCSALPCVNKLLGGNNSKTFSITWISCVDPDPSNTYCNGFGINGTTSTLKLCYMPGSCDHIIAQITNPPSCLSCLPNPYCISLVVSCSDADHFTFGGNETFPNDIITVTIAADPKISITCGPPGNFSNCSGSLK